MWDIVWLICTACCVALATNSAIKPSGKLTITPSVIDLDSNVTSYTVSCQLDFVKDGFDSSLLYIEKQNERIKSEILDERTITAVEKPLCGTKMYLCYGNGSGLDVGKVTIGWKPAEIFAKEIRCISENLVGLRCKIPVKRRCDLSTTYKMSMINRFGSSLCFVEVVGGVLMYDSENEKQRCLYRNGAEILRFDLEVTNDIGSRAMSFELNNYDLVRPAAVRRMKVINVTSRDLEVRWMEDVPLDHLNRDFQYQFMLISEYGSNVSLYEDVSKMIYRFSTSKLQSYTNYTLKVRLRLIPKTPRAFEEDYWSQWSSVTFKTLSSKPDFAPKTIPGAFSIKNRKGNLATIEVYWEHVPEYLQNGPGFSYNVTAKSDTGQKYYPVQKPSSSAFASFENMEIAHYRIFVSCLNDLGSVESHNEVEVFPTNSTQQPKIKRVLNSDPIELSWYPPIHQQDLTNFTIMYCNFTSSNACQNSTRFEVVSRNTTAFKVSSSTALNFAVSANFQTHSTPLSWQECIVTPSETPIGTPKFEIADLQIESFVVIFDSDCVERSFYESMKFLVRKGSEVVYQADVEPYWDRIEVGGLSPGEEYEVQVQVFDGVRVVQGTRQVVMLAANDYWLKVIFFLSCGAFMIVTILTTVTRRIRKIFDIKVETPQLLTAKKSASSEVTLQIEYKDDHVNISRK